LHLVSLKYHTAAMHVTNRPLPRYLLGILFMHAPQAPHAHGAKHGPADPRYRSVTGSRPAASARPNNTSDAARTLGSVLS
jgi:hypothetical protein